MREIASYKDVIRAVERVNARKEANGNEIVMV